ncbi:MAG TPA: DUF4124 domain-containing protein [Burkholderiales bacterium]|nr:DUF4124 domain-containing protein [Burkholderiales bacterium]
MNRKAWLTGLLLALAAPAYAQLYKWVDADGKVHYSDQPPPATAQKEQKLNIRTTPPESAAPSTEGEAPAAKPAAGPTTPAEREMEYRKRKVEEEQKQQKAEAEQKANQENCLNAQRRARSYQEEGRIFTVDEKGERVYMDDDARMRNLRDAQLEIAKYCK